MTKPDNTVLCICLIMALAWGIIGAGLLDFSAGRTIAGMAIFIAAFYFGRWWKRNIG